MIEIHLRNEEARKYKHKLEMKLTWTLLWMSFSYVVFVAPIFLCGIFGISGTWNLFCFILYWFQVMLFPKLNSFCICCFQYTLNFVVYAARSEQYRRAYLSYLKEKLSQVFGINGSQIHSTIFIINPALFPSFRRSASTPDLYKNSNQTKIMQPG